MSLHAQTSPEAQAALDAQKRNSMISSIIIALLGLVLVGLILWVISIAGVFKSNEKIYAFNSGKPDDTEITKPEMTDQVERQPSAPSSSAARVVASSTPSPTAIPVPENVVESPSLEFGDGDDFGDGWGDGGGGGGGGGGGFGIPASMAKRCTKADRLKRLAKEGGTPQCEDAVVNALRYLQKTQAKDGSWCGSKKVGMTGLALLAYLGHCETPTSPEFGETVQKAIVFLVNVGTKNDGQLSLEKGDRHWCYEHAIATYAIAEAYTLCKEFGVTVPGLKEVVTKAGGFIVSRQHSSGGWDYAYDMSGQRGGDSSIVCWHLQALKALKHTGLKIGGLKGSGKEAVRYLEKCQAKGGMFGYTPGNTRHGGSMTGGSVLCLQQWDKGRRSHARKGIKWLNKNTNKFKYDDETAALYQHYYIGQAMMNSGGANWQNYNKLFMQEVLDAQNGDGSFKSPGGGAKIKGVATSYVGDGGYAKHYRTCLCTLMLEVYYRFLPGSK